MFQFDRDRRNSLLLNAARDGNRAKVLRLVANGADVNAKVKGVRSSDGQMPLHSGCINGHVDVVKSLLAKGANINAKDIAGKTPLHWASRNDKDGDGHAGVVEVLLAKGADVNVKDKNGQMPLHYAIENDHAGVAEMLLAKGADVNAENKNGQTPLHNAIKYRHVSVAEVLLAKRANVNAKDNGGLTPLDLAKSRGYDSVAKLLEDFCAGRNVLSRLPGATRNVQSSMEDADETVGGKVFVTSVGTSVPRFPKNSNQVVLTDEDHRGYESDAPKTQTDQINITDDDYIFLKMGRKLVRDGGVIPVISKEERSALRTLATHMVDFERSLESVRELPSSLTERDPMVADYFFFFTSAFERIYVAAQVITTGAVTLELDNMSNDMLEELLGSVSWVAEMSQLPFVGCISIFSTIIDYQRRTKKKNTFIAFEQFFRGNSRDQYLLTYRKLAEQICLRLNTSSLTNNDSETVGNLERQVKKKIIKPIRKHLRKVHLDTIEKLKPVEQQAMADLALITKEVLRLHREDHSAYDKLCTLDEVSKASYFIGHIFGTPSHLDQKTSNNGSMQVDSHKPSDHESLAHTKNVESAELEHLMKKIQNLEEDNKRLQKHTDMNSNMAQEFKKIQAQVRKLSSKAKSEKDVTYSCDGQAQVQINSKRPKEEETQQLEHCVKRLEQLDKDFRQMQIQQEKQSRQLEKINLENFINNRVLTCHEAFEFTRKILSMAEIEVSDDGSFVHNGKDYCIGEARKDSLISKKKTLWKGRIDVKLEGEHQGVKSVMDWFDKSKLRPLYERHKKGAIHTMFPGELEEPSLPDTTQLHHYQNQQEDRNKLFCNNLI